MPNKNDLMVMGNSLVSSFQEKANQGGDLAQWNRECALSCDILLDYLKDSSSEIDKVLLVSRLIKDKHITAKPPVISTWCNKISEYLLTAES
ncbi:hypothetical protein [Psychromonas algicola]|uniref:hypothetical protein n=1 Tax=Psychromonas algicola TaxID=2555642 RepID=UPI00106786A8|nr:hypothetical protein [Psychromonas sp. RZ5]TEW52848.1 hypothetical protein E2R67_00120 [Psychromonas sp. RZ5]